jgi:hypothetical protein
VQDAGLLVHFDLPLEQGQPFQDRVLHRRRHTSSFPCRIVDCRLLIVGAAYREGNRSLG